MTAPDRAELWRRARIAGDLWAQLYELAPCSRAEEVFDEEVRRLCAASPDGTAPYHGALKAARGRLLREARG